MKGFIFLLIECDEDKADCYCEYLEKQIPISRQDDEDDNVWLCDVGVFDFILLPEMNIEPVFNIIKTFSEKSCPEPIQLYYGELKSKTIHFNRYKLGILESKTMRTTTFLRDILPTEYEPNFSIEV